MILRALFCFLILHGLTGLAFWRNVLKYRDDNVAFVATWILVSALCALDGMIILLLISEWIVGN